MSPESITTTGDMDSGQPLRGFRNDCGAYTSFRQSALQYRPPPRITNVIRGMVETSMNKVETIVVDRKNLLAGFGGRTPPTPGWFDKAIANAPERSFVDVRGAAIETLTWGQRGKPGVLFLHGNGANADW